MKPPWWPLLVLLGVQAAYLVFVSWAASSHAAKPELLAIDGLRLEGSEASFGARVIAAGHRGIPREIPGKKATFVEESLEAGALPPSAFEAVFSPDGFALAPPTAAAKPGIHSFHVHLEDSAASSLDSAETHVVVATAPGEARILFVAIPQTIESSADAQALEALARDHVVVYLALRKLDSPSRLRDWLAHSKLPPGPILTPRSGVNGSSLPSLLANLRLNRWTEKPWAVIRQSFDAGPFVTLGARVVLLGAPAHEDPNEHAIFQAPTWNEARKIVAERR